jgi:hypothetical protein
MKCFVCGIWIKENKSFCSKKCSNDFRKNNKIEEKIKASEKFLLCDIGDFIKTLVNKKTNKLEPNKMTPEYFNNNYILTRYFEILDKTKDYKTLSFKDRVYMLLGGLDCDKTIDDLLGVIVKKNGGLDFNKLNKRWLELNNFLAVSKQLEKIDRSYLEEYLYLIKNTNSSCLTCGGKTTFKGYSKGYAKFCSVKCLSNNDIVKETKIKHSMHKKLETLFGIDTIIPLFEKKNYIGAKQGTKYKFECSKCHKEFESRISNGHIPLCPICDYKHFNGNSKMENELISILEKEHILEKSNRTVLNGKEIDIYIPIKKLAIEFDGIYWHSELNGKSKNYHLDKTIKCMKKDIHLMHIFENEWLEKRDIVLSVINAKLGKFEKKIYARKCIVSEISSTTKNKFLEENHLQGQEKSSIKLGLFFDGELVSVMTFGNSRFNRHYQYEMHRFCNKVGYQIIGGASKLFKHFLRCYLPESVVTYSDIRYSTDTYYEKMGFTKINTLKPNYFYFKVGSTKLMPKIQFQKYKLKNKLNIFNIDLTEWENMQLNGYDRIWDCGNNVFEWKAKKE